MARRLNGEIVGCDALQLYRGFDLATAKPSPEERGEVRHHLVDCIDPRRNYTLADYVRDAERAIADIASRGRVPLVVGGTGMYFRGLFRGIVDLPEVDRALRERLRGMAERRGVAALHRWLSRLDPSSAQRVAKRDTHRVIRALELALGPRTTWSERLKRQGTWESGRERYRGIKFALDMDRARLRERLDRRVERFFEAGLGDEVRRLLQGGVSPRANAFKAIGYREVLQAIEEGRDPRTTVAAVQRNTYRYSKRQRIWFRKEGGMIWCDAQESVQTLADRIVARWNGFLRDRAGSGGSKNYNGAPERVI